MPPNHPLASDKNPDAGKVGLVGALIGAVLAALAGTALMVKNEGPNTAPATPSTPTMTQPPATPTAPQATQPSVPLPIPGPLNIDKGNRPKPPPPDPG
jgi:hypothetical protein